MFFCFLREREIDRQRFKKIDIQASQRGRREGKTAPMRQTDKVEKKEVGGGGNFVGNFVSNILNLKWAF